MTAVMSASWHGLASLVLRVPHRACNQDLAYGSYRVVVGHPRRERQLRQLDLPAKRPVVRFNTGPGYEVQPDGTEEFVGEVLHMWVPRR
jgi:hypothetical protein